MNIYVIEAETKHHLAHCFVIRYRVFVMGQNVPLDREIDRDEDNATHYLLFCDDEPSATARVRVIADTAKIERVAVLDKYQGKGLGRGLMEHIIGDWKQAGKVKALQLGSQNHAMPFYERLGFEICGDEYMDAGIPHHEMKLAV